MCTRRAPRGPQRWDMPWNHFGPTQCRGHTDTEPARNEAADDDGEDGKERMLVMTFLQFYNTLTRGGIGCAGPQRKVPGERDLVL